MNKCITPGCKKIPIENNQLCETCRAEYSHRQYHKSMNRMTRNERLQGMADRGCDTWEEYRGEK